MSNVGVEVVVFDTTLRDGAQSLPEVHQFPDGSKTKIAEEIALLGAGVIEAGFPATPLKEGATISDKEEVIAVANSVGRTNYEVQAWHDGIQTIVSRPPIIAGLSRTTPGDIETTWEAVSGAERPRIHTFISTDAAHMKAKFPGKSPEAVLQMGIDAVEQALSLSSGHSGASNEFSAEAASTTDFVYLEKVARTIVSKGIDVINFPDTIGRRRPFWMLDFYKRVIGWAMEENPDITISGHNHNEGDHATSNTLALIMAAAQYSHAHNQRVKIQLETTICGLGGQTGNADVFPVVNDLFEEGSEQLVPIRFEFNPGRSVSVAQAVMGYAGLEVDRQSPIVGEDVNVHRAGVHSDGVLKGDYTMYSSLHPTFWGHQADAVHEDGKYQGRAGRGAIRMVD